MARFEVVRSLITPYIESFERKHILDLGCGDLYFIKRFFAENPKSSCHAVDIAFDEDFFLLNKDIGIKLYNRIEDVYSSNPGIKFDVIFLMDVVEHIKDDIGFLKELVGSPYVTKSTVF